MTLENHATGSNGEPLDVVGDFRILERLGEGSSAVVYRAVNQTIQAQVALKRWRYQLTRAQRMRFLSECRLQWQLSGHPNIVRLLWAEAPDDGPPWLAMELFEQSLAGRLLGPPLPDAEAWRIALGLVRGLAAMHALGVLHRDVKPGNVLLTGGRVALGDLGISILADWHTVDAAAGTDAYVAPELQAGAPPSFRSDVYSAAVTLRRLFGACPPPDVERLLTRGASHDPRDRPADAGQLEADLVDRAAAHGAAALPEEPAGDDMNFLMALELLDPSVGTDGCGGPARPG